ncbi:MAG TPA: FAD-dependent oxidoreductase, partial [Actinomycetota bacterium]|nr:FAD-dependent oxidoreductase [Actinomycetota bacterium]
GCEYASIFIALGARVTLVQGEARLVPFLDGEISDLLAEVLLQEGMDLRLGVKARAVERANGMVQVTLEDGAVVKPNTVLVAMGTVGNSAGLGLEEAGVEVDARGRIIVDDEYRTTAEGVYAAGDVIGSPALASTGMEQGRVAVCHAFGIPFKEAVDPHAPYGVYTIPEVAMAGLTEEAARAEGLDVAVGRGRFSENPRARIAGFGEGMVKLVFRRSDHALVGVHVLGEMASELVHVGQLAIAEGLPIDRFIQATFNVPTRTDAYKYAAYDGLQNLAD